MTKSIEEKAMEAYPDIMGISQGSYRSAYVKGAKARDAQWSAVVNELRDALENIKIRLMHCSLTSFPINVRELDGSISQHRPKSNEGHAYSIAIDALTKADQLLKEMGIKL